jgi:hypothetical protein
VSIFHGDKPLLARQFVEGQYYFAAMSCPYSQANEQSRFFHKRKEERDANRIRKWGRPSVEGIAKVNCD